MGIAFSPDGSRLASAGADETVRIWDVFRGHELLSLRGPKDRVHGVAFSPDGIRSPRPRLMDWSGSGRARLIPSRLRATTAGADLTRN